jgi:hypothetical protein
MSLRARADKGPTAGYPGIVVRRDEARLPEALPEGTTLVDLPDGEVRERAELVATLLSLACSELNRFVDEGCPPEEDEKVRCLLTGALQQSASMLPGAGVWREERESAFREVIESGALRDEHGDVPDLVLAALWCDLALKAEGDLWDALGEHSTALKDAEACADMLNRLRAH